MSDKQTLDVYNDKAAEYAEKFCHGVKSDRHLDAFLARLPANASVHDLGCGPGQSSVVMARAGHNVLATDASTEMVKLANAQDGVTAQLATFDEIDGDAIHDGVYANFSLLHADREELPTYLGAIAKSLKPGGAFHIGMKSGTGTKRDHIGRRYTFVTKEELVTLLTDAGLTPVYTQTGEEVGLAGTLDPWIVMQAVKDA
ncbi:MAG: class I SAM-dependent methyltransferase [Pseudomonadota bacterium]